LRAIHLERSGATLAESAVILEVEYDRVLAGRQLFGSGDGVTVDAHDVVVEDGLALQ